MNTDLIHLGRYLKEVKYDFVTISPESHKTVLSRKHVSHDTSNSYSILRNLLGWNLWVPYEDIPDAVRQSLERNDLLIREGELIRSKIRASTLDSLLFLHSAYPTLEKGSVFFGPDSYRFVRFIKSNGGNHRRIFDIGCGTGVGGLALSNYIRNETSVLPEVYLADINPKALEFSQINAAINEIEKTEVIESHLLSKAPPEIDLYISNPPYIIDDSRRTYRHGGDHYGSNLSVDIVREFLKGVSRPRRLLLYTGSCIVEGRDIFLDQIETLLSDSQVTWSYSEIDPDVFGEQLSSPAYTDVDRIAAVGVDIKCL